MKKIPAMNKSTEFDTGRRNFVELLCFTWELIIS